MPRISKKQDTEAIKRARAMLHSPTGAFRTGEAIKSGIHPRTIYAMRDQGIIERMGRGMYRFADMPSLGNPDLATVALKVPKGVICLISALSYHELTTEIPHDIFSPWRGAPNLQGSIIRRSVFSGSVALLLRRALSSRT